MAKLASLWFSRPVCKPRRQVFLCHGLYYLHFDEVQGDFVGASKGAKHQLHCINEDIILLQAFFSGFRRRKIGPYVHTPFNFLNLTEKGSFTFERFLNPENRS